MFRTIPKKIAVAIIPSALALLLVLIPHNALADQTPKFVPLANYQKSPQINSLLTGNGTLPQYFNQIFTITLSIGAILAVLRIAYGGYMYMGSADMWGNKQRAKEIIGDAIIGLILLFGIYLILYQINPNLLNLNILQDVKQANATTCQSASCTGVNGNQDITANNTSQIYTTPQSGDYCYQFTSGNAQRYGCGPSMSACVSAYSGLSGDAQNSVTSLCQLQP